jgi:hypothetical protein
VGAGVEAFKKDWGVYPPSRWTNEPKEFQDACPAACLAYYLMGPGGRGWGKPEDGATPFGDNSDRTWGPYFCDKNYGSDDLPKLQPITDWFSPPKFILYFRAEPGREPLFDASDVPLDPTGQMGFASQENFEMLVRPKGKDGNRHWVREDYLLISCGVDRYWGVVKQEISSGGSLTGRMTPATSEDKEVFCDDITNFAYAY